jgi:hypothetical protein
MSGLRFALTVGTRLSAPYAEIKNFSSLLPQRSHSQVRPRAALRRHVSHLELRPVEVQRYFKIKTAHSK